MMEQDESSNPNFFLVSRLMLIINPKIFVVALARDQGEVAKTQFSTSWTTRKGQFLDFNIDVQGTHAEDLVEQ